MAPTKAAGTLRRSARLAPDPTAAAAVVDSHRVTKSYATSKTERVECSACGRTLAASAFYKRLPTKNCKHGVHTCKSCLKSWITMQLEATTHDKLSCSECPEVLQHANVRAFATQETYAKYDRLERRAFQDRTPGWRWCLSPTCRAGQVHTPLLEIGANVSAKAKKGGKKKSRDEDVCVCDECGSPACVPCDRPFHDGETCAQYRARVQRQQGKEEKATLARIERSCKKCPGCGKNIEKNGGCDQVRCTQCGMSFCWLCEMPYLVINARGHAAGCTYAQPNRFDPHAPQNAPGNNADLGN